MELSADDVQNPFDNTSTLTHNKTQAVEHDRNLSSTAGLGEDVLQAVKEGLDRSPEAHLCKRCHKLMESLSDSTTTNSESGFSEGSCTLESSEFNSELTTSSQNHVLGRPTLSTGYRGDAIPGEHREQCLICLRRSASEQQCSCEFRKSFDETLDPEGAVLLKILDLPSKVR